MEERKKQDIDFLWEKYSQDCPLKVQSDQSTTNLCDGNRNEYAECKKDECAPWHFLSQYIEDWKSWKKKAS